MTNKATPTRAPRPFLPDVGAEARDAVPDLPPDWKEVVAGAAGSSPFLAGLVGREAAWLPEALADPAAALARLGEELAGPRKSAELGRDLRAAKRRVALLVALMDLGGAWDLWAVTGALSDFAERALRRGLSTLADEAMATRRLPAPVRDAPDAGLVVLGMGKLGARELNYSSDIDLICLIDETAHDPDQFGEARAGAIRVTRNLARLIGEVTADGYVFRTDLRLRPDAAVTPVALPMEVALSYYESLGRTWERAAHIKARPVAGDLEAGARYLKALTPFVWRRHLDFAAIEDIHDILRRIRVEHVGNGLDGRDLKLAPGGIRDIEFLAQTRQLIVGGRDPSLRIAPTVKALRALADKGWLDGAVTERLVDHYATFREIEHRLQMIGDAQTHSLPASTEGWGRLAALMDRDAASLKAEIAERQADVRRAIEPFFDQAPVGRTATTEGPDPDFGAEAARRWLTYPALRSPRAQAIFDRIKGDILGRLARAGRPDEALAQFDAFLAGLPAGVQILSLFQANPPLRQLLVDIAATAPALAAYLGRNAGVLDAVIGGEFFGPWPGRAQLLPDAEAVLAGAGDYETALDALRGWAKDWHFRVGVHHLQGLITGAEAGTQYAELAEAVVAALWPVVQAEVARRHGPAPGRGGAVLGMGSLGTGRLHATSDLDLIVIYDPAGEEASDGPRPLATRAWYARATQALVTALSAPMAQGRLYEVDMRLRPSGRQGPVATALSAWETYQRDEAWTWEHLALTRARPIAGPDDLQADIARARAAILADQRGRARIVPDLVGMRARLAAATPEPDPWGPKLGPGRMQDIDLFAEAASLAAGQGGRSTAAQLPAAADLGWIAKAEAQELQETAGWFWEMQAALRLVSGTRGSAPEGDGAAGFVAKRLGLVDAGEIPPEAARRARRAEEIIEAGLDRARGTASLPAKDEGEA